MFLYNLSCCFANNMFTQYIIFLAKDFVCVHFSLRIVLIFACKEFTCVKFPSFNLPAYNLPDTSMTVHLID